MGKGQRKDKVELSWRFHPMEQSPKLAACCLLVALTCGYGAVIYIDSLPLSLPIVAFFLYTLRSLFLPTDHLLTKDEVVVYTPLGKTKMTWDRFGGYRVSPNSIVLTRLARPSFLDKFSGLVLRVGKNERESVIDFVKERIKG